MDPSHTTEVVPYLASSGSIMYLQRCLKGHPLYQRFVAAFPGADKWAHRFIAAVGALIAAVGIGYTFDWTAAAGGQVLITIPNLTALRHGLWDFSVVYLFQQGWYDATIAKPMIQLASSPQAPTVIVGDDKEK